MYIFNKVTLYILLVYSIIIISQNEPVHSLTYESNLII